MLFTHAPFFYDSSGPQRNDKAMNKNESARDHAKMESFQTNHPHKRGTHGRSRPGKFKKTCRSSQNTQREPSSTSRADRVALRGHIGGAFDCNIAAREG